MPRLGEKYDIEIESISKPREQYATQAHLAQGLPKAPAVVLGDQIVIKGADASQENLEAMIRQHLGLPAPGPRRKGIFSRILNR